MRLRIRIQEEPIMFQQLDSPGGHIAVCLVLVIVGMGAAHINTPHASELVVFALGVLSRSMYGNGK